MHVLLDAGSILWSNPFVEHFKSGHEGPMLYCYVLAGLKIKFTYLLTNYSTAIIPYWLMQVRQLPLTDERMGTETSDTLYIQM